MRRGAIEILRIIPEGSREMNAVDFIRGLGNPGLVKQVFDGPPSSAVGTETTYSGKEIRFMKNKKQIILNCEELETRFALLRNGRLEEYEIERRDEDELLAGSIYLGRITHLEKKLEAAFVDIGAAKNAFLHYKDMLPASYDMLDDIRHMEADGALPAKRRKKGSMLSKVADRIRGLVGKTNKAQRLKEFETKLHSGKITVADIPKMFPESPNFLCRSPKGRSGPRVRAFRPISQFPAGIWCFFRIPTISGFRPGSTTGRNGTGSAKFLQNWMFPKAWG